MKYALTVLLAFFNVSCTSFYAHNTVMNFPDSNQKTISIHKLVGGNYNTLGYAEITEDTCAIYLRKYPICLQHEIRHCFEGNWHEGRKTDEDCFNH